MIPLDSVSLLLLVSAMAIYAVAFVAFAVDLARRSSEATIAADAAFVQEVAGLNEAGGAVAVAAPPAPPVVRVRRPAARAGLALLAAGWILEVGADVLRGLAAGRVPWANMYEFSMTGTVLVVAVFLAVNTRLDLKFLGVWITGFVLLVLGISITSWRVAVAPLPPALQSYWLVIHVFVASLGTAVFAIAAGLSVTQLLQSLRARRGGLKLLTTVPDANRLENLAYRISVIGFILWTFTLIAGAIWADHAWGRYWGWDTKEVWTFIIWTVYAGYLHARATRGWRGNGSAWLNLIGFACILFNFGVVNVFFKGLHTYSGLTS